MIFNWTASLREGYIKGKPGPNRSNEFLLCIKGTFGSRSLALLSQRLWVKECVWLIAQRQGPSESGGIRLDYGHDPPIAHQTR